MALSMTLFLLLSGLLAPMMPVVEAATIANVNTAQAAALQSDGDEGEGEGDLVPLDREEEAPPADDGGDQPPADDSSDAPPADDGNDAPPADDGNDLPPADDGDDLPPADDGDEDPTNGMSGEQEEEFNDPAQINVTLRWCSLNADVAGAFDGNSLLNDCQNAGPEALVSLTSGSGNYPPQQSGVFSFPGQVNFSNLESDLWRLNIQTAPNTVEALFCDGYLYVDGNQRSNTKPYGAAFRSQTSTPAFEFQTQNNEVINCDWFGQMPRTGMLGLVKWNCPEGFDFAAATYTTVKEACTAPVAGPVGFEVTVNENNVNYVNQQDTQPAAMNAVLFGDVPAGTAKVSEKVPEGYELAGVFCSYTDWNNPGNNTQQPQMQTINNGNTWEYKSSPFSLMTCDVFNIPHRDDDQDDHDDAEDTYGHIEITKLNCSEAPPAGSESDIVWYDANCQDLRPGVTFTFDNADQPEGFKGDTSGDPNPGRLNAENLPSGSWTITEEPEQGTRLGAAFCLDDADSNFMQYPVESNSIRVDLKADQLLRCAFLNVPVDEDEELDDDAMYGVYVDKYLCTMMPDESNNTYEWYRDNCTQPQDGVHFGLWKSLEGVVSGGPTASGSVQLYDGAPDSGDYEIRENTYEDFQPVAVFCRTIGLDGPMGEYMRYDLSGNSIYPSFSGDHGLNCQWFNYGVDPLMLPQVDGYGDLKLHKYLCTTMPDPSADYSWYTMNCTTTQDGIQFTLGVPDPPTGIITSTNDIGTAPGYIQMGGVTTGTYPLTETMYPGHLPSAVFCGYSALDSMPGDADYSMYPLTGYAIDVEIRSDQLIHCKWFNVQEEGEGISLTLYKWDCPEGTMYYMDSDYYSAECDTQMAGVPFTVTDYSGTTPFQSDIDGYQIDNLLPDMNGYITITELIPDGYGTPVVFCRELNADANPYMTVTMGSVTIQPSMQDDYQCFWYNIPDDGFSVTLYKWQCPEGTMYGQMADYYSAYCATQMADVPFEITDDNGTQSTTSDIDGRQIDGLMGEVTITETIPPGYGYPVVFCRLLNDETSTAMMVNMGSITLMPAYDDDYQCFWYNIPAPENTVTVYKWECPEGTMPDATLQWLIENCTTPMEDVNFTLKHAGGTSMLTTDATGSASFTPVPKGQIVITEHVPSGYSKFPLLMCGWTAQEDGAVYDAFPQLVTPVGSTWSSEITYDNTDYFCHWYNIPEPESTVTIYKWRCPDGIPAEHTSSWFTNNCTTLMDVNFTLTDTKGPRMLPTTGGVVQWTDVATGAVQITEHIPSGYAQQPYLVCYVVTPNGMAGDSFNPTTVNGTWNTTIDAPGSEIVCNWYNWYLGPGDITVYKWTCPEGYDKYAWGADPMVDCTMATNGITFKLDQPDPEVDLFSDTGDSIDGAVYFGGLEPGDYTISEMVSMGQFKDVFVWQCYGLTTSSVQPTPLSTNQYLDFTIVGGDKIVCHWFNVPYPEYGYIVVTKFNCSTEKYVSDVYCYTNQTGQYFDLQRWNGSTWTTVQSGTTDVSGKVTFNDLDGGDYKLVEPNTQACLMKSSNITPGKNIGVNVGEGTTVHVYNCKTPPPPQKTPTKYPNTGVAPVAESEESRMPGVEITGLLGLLGLAMNRRRMLAGAGLVTAGTAATALPLLNAQELQPLDSTPAPGTPAPEDFWCATPTAATPDAEATAEAEGTPTFDPCNRGPIPVQMRIPEIGVDAPIEYLEIIDGLMQQPTGDTHITWYKETSRLGEVGNGIYAAHVNWYGNPEGIFFRLESLQAGDVIEIDGDNQQTYLFEVQWSEDFPSDEEPPDEALGLTDEVSITLITCGGEWSSALAEYDHRTLVRAVMRN